jgi:spermidine synthase
MHRAAFVLPTFAKKELEAYCVSTERVSFYKSVLAITLYLVCFHSLRIFLKASSHGENLRTILQEQPEETAATAPKISVASKSEILTAS